MSGLCTYNYLTTGFIQNLATYNICLGLECNVHLMKYSISVSQAFMFWIYVFKDIEQY